LERRGLRKRGGGTALPSLHFGVACPRADAVENTIARHINNMIDARAILGADEAK